MATDERHHAGTEADDDVPAVRPSLPEEATADADFDADQATRAILTESEERVNDPGAGISKGSVEQEHRRSEDTV